MRAIVLALVACGAAPPTPPPAPEVAAPESPDTLAHVLAERDRQFASLRVGEGVELDGVTRWVASVSFEPFRPGTCTVACAVDVCDFGCVGRDPSRDIAFLSYQALKIAVAKRTPATWYAIEQASGTSGRVVTWGPSPLERYIGVQLDCTAEVSQLQIVIEARSPTRAPGS